MDVETRVRLIIGDLVLAKAVADAEIERLKAEIVALSEATATCPQ